MTSIVGVGMLTAVTVLAETNGFNLVRNKKQLVSYAGWMWWKGHPVYRSGEGPAYRIEGTGT